MIKEHTDKHFEAELRELKEKILKMGGMVEEMIDRAQKSLFERNSNLAREILICDSEVNRIEVAIDNHCLELLARRQPAASDLRFITIGLRISKDLERMGDLAVDIGEQVIELNKELQLKPFEDLPQIASKTKKMVKSALDAFVNRDPDLAERVCEADDEVDALKRKVFDDVVLIMQKNPSAVLRGVRLILVSRHFERIADHATNIAEEVIFMVKGKDIRHGGMKLKK